MNLRPYRPADAPALLALFRDTVRRINASDYSPAQIAAWASDEIDPAAWAARFAGRFVVVAEATADDANPSPRPAGSAERAIAGFAELVPADGHVDRFYVSADHVGCGVGRAMLAALVEEARRLGLPRLTVDASITARPFFQRHGFVVIREQQVPVRGATLTNFRMERPLPTP